MSEPTDADTAHEAGGTYAQADLSPAAERSRLRTTQHYPAPSAKPEEEASSAASPAASALPPGSQLDAGTS